MYGNIGSLSMVYFSKTAFCNTIKLKNEFNAGFSGFGLTGVNVRIEMRSTSRSLLREH
jgi:hypothetical protein